MRNFIFGSLFCLGLILVGLYTFGVNIQSLENTSVWKKAYAALKGSCDGVEVVYDSNVSGNFGIYRKCSTSENAQVIVDVPEWHEIYPDPSPDGTQLVFAKAKEPYRDSPAEVWLMNLESGESTQITASGTFPTFGADGKTIYYERNRLAVFKYDIESATETQIFPWPGSGFEGRPIAKPQVSADGEWLYITTDRPQRWNAWRVNLRTGQAERIGHGCQPAPYTTSDAPVWIAKRRTGKGSDVYRFNAESKRSTIIEKAGEETFGYFPSVGPNGKYLVYSGCRCAPNNMSHETGNYEVLLVDLESGTRTPLTANGKTNRWPKILPSTE